MKGNRYAIRDIAALLYPIDLILDHLKSLPPSEVVSEAILKRMEREELIYAIYEVLEALLDQTPAPEDGHPGYQEAVVAELLAQTYEGIVVEMDEDESDYARRAAWTSFLRLCGAKTSGGLKNHWIIEESELDLTKPRPYRSKKLTAELWNEILLGEHDLWSEFLWDVDWRLEMMLDLPEEATKQTRGAMGMDLDVVHQLPPTPSKSEANMAEHFIKYILWKEEVLLESE